MTGVDASHRIVADLLRARTGQHLSETRMWRVSSALAGIFRARGISNLDQLVCLLAAPEGLAKFQGSHPDVPVWTASIDSHLNEHGYILPGLGDAGDRMYGTR